MPERWNAAAWCGVLKAARTIAAQESAAEPSPGQMLDAWRRIVEENLFVR